MLGPYATDTEKQALRDELGLSKPIITQLGNYFVQIARGDLGTSLIYKTPVLAMIRERFLPTMELAILSLCLASLISIPLGIMSALRHKKILDYGTMSLALLGICIPNFWLGPLLVMLFSLKLGWLPVSERTDISSYVLPAVSLGLALGSILSRMARTSMLETFKEDYVRTAKAKGCSYKSVIFKHTLRNAALPIVTILGLQFGVLLTGAIITERIFDWPGLGTLLLDGIFNRDYPIVQGCVLVFSGIYLIVNLLTDLAYAVVDPRISFGGSK